MLLAEALLGSAREFPRPIRFCEGHLGRRPDTQLLAVDGDRGGALGFAQNEAGQVFGGDVVAGAVIGALGVYFGAFVMFLEAVQGDPIITVVARRGSSKPNAVGAPA